MANNKIFIRKTAGQRLYKWSPQPTSKKKTLQENPYFCNAVSGAPLGEDWTTTYDYNVIVIDGVQKRIAYVACDYVE